MGKDRGVRRVKRGRIGKKGHREEGKEEGRVGGREGKERGGMREREGVRGGKGTEGSLRGE